MTEKAKNITGWILSGLLALVLISSASMKLIGGDEITKGAETMGLTATGLKLIGVIEVVSIILFLVPRTGILGTLLLAAYLGGAIVTHLEHGQPFIVPVMIQSLVWVTAFIRFPELNRRILGKAVV